MPDDRSPRALAAAERLYKRKPDATMEEFRKVCERADKSVAKLSGRKFNAKYILPFRRSTAAKLKREGKAPRRRRRHAAPASATAAKKMAALIKQRDAELLQAAGDPVELYKLAADLDDFAAKLLAVAKR